ncbi:acetyl-CoA synthetase-like protein, partial [Colletotrichum somersetense]
WVVSSFNHDLLAPLGAVGELVLEGTLVGRRYLGDPDKTAAAFTNDPAWLSRGGADNRGRSGRVYHTGDLIRFTDDGALVIIGRKDAQLRIGGQRVELEEVETHARRLLPDSQSSSATLAADVVSPQGQTSKMLVLFIAAVGKMDAAVRDHVLRGLAEALPAYMVLFAFMSLPMTPTIATGKVSRR